MNANTEILRDRLVDLAVAPLVELDRIGRHGDEAEIARERGRYEAARDAFIAFLVTFGQVAEFQSANVADIIIENAHKRA
jgi:hypothetical protein